MGKSRVQNPLRPFIRQGKPFAPPFSMAKTLSSYVKTTSELAVPPSAWLKVPPPPLPFISYL